MSQFELELRRSELTGHAGEVTARVVCSLRCGWDRPMSAFWSDVYVTVTESSEELGGWPAIEWALADYLRPVSEIERDMWEPTEPRRVCEEIARASCNRFLLLRAFMGSAMTATCSARYGGCQGPVWVAGSSSRGPVNLTRNERDMIARPEWREHLPRIEHVLNPDVDKRLMEMVEQAVGTFAGPQTLEATSVHGEV
ncbi:MAG: hypothetical protein EBV20_12385 [Betaproteobacteria bacterium]|nr:hypothetical protein [Betaproteobacteria bacterium]